MADPKNSNPKELPYYEQLENYFDSSYGNSVEKLKNFTKYVPRQDITKFLVRNELFQKVLNISGSIIELGVLHGAGLMAFAHLSSIFEHLNNQRQIIGFDTFSGFPIINPKKDNKIYAKKGNLAVDSFYDLEQSIKLYDMNRFLNHTKKVELVKGNITKTVPQYIKKNPHLVVSLLYIDVDIYEPTITALKYLLPRMPKGAVLAFDDVNDKAWPGETLAILDTIGMRSLKLERFSYDTRVAYAVLD